MNNKMVAKELVAVARDLAAADTFKCPDCGSKVLDQTKYCVKCKKKVKKAANLIDEQGVDERLSEISKKMHVLTRAVQNAVGKKSLTRQSDGVMGEVYGLAKEIKEAYSGSNQYRGMGEPNGALMLSIGKDLFLIANLLEKMFKAQAVYDKEVATLMNRINSKMVGIV